MCLRINEENTLRYKQLLEEKGKISVYKTFSIKKGRLTSVYQNFIYYEGENTAQGQLHKIINNIFGGALHAYQERNNAEKIVKTDIQSAKYYNIRPEDEIVVRFVGKKEDFIAAGNKDIAFKKLTMDQKEVQRLKKWAINNKRALYLKKNK